MRRVCLCVVKLRMGLKVERGAGEGKKNAHSLARAPLSSPLSISAHPAATAAGTVRLGHGEGGGGRVGRQVADTCPADIEVTQCVRVCVLGGGSQCLF